MWTAAQSLHGSSIPIAVFALTGYSTVLLWRNMPARCIGAIGPNLALMYHRHVKVSDIFASRLLLEGGGATISFIVLAVLFTFIGLIAPPQDVGKILIAWFMTAWFGAALAVLMGALSEQSETIEKLWGPTSYLLFPLSGAAFMVDSLPVAAQNIVLLLPMVHGVEMLRDGYFGSSFKAHYDIGYMALVCSVLTLFALAKARQISRTVTPE